MTLLLASLNASDMRDASRANFAVAKFNNLGVDVAAVQETHFESDLDDYVPKNLFEVYSAYGGPSSRGVSLLVKRSLNAVTDIVFAGAGGRLIVADVAVRSYKFRVVAVYAPNIVAERKAFFRQL